MLDQMQAGFTVTLMGMGVVFVLLTLLIYVVQGMSKLCRMIEGAPPAPTTSDAPAVEEEIVSVIGAAVSAYRRRHKN